MPANPVHPVLAQFGSAMQQKHCCTGSSPAVQYSAAMLIHPLILLSWFISFPHSASTVSHFCLSFSFRAWKKYVLITTVELFLLNASIRRPFPHGTDKCKQCLSHRFKASLWSWGSCSPPETFQTVKSFTGQRHVLQYIKAAVTVFWVAWVWNVTSITSPLTNVLINLPNTT